jgi:hypothetical protein
MDNDIFVTPSNSNTIATDATKVLIMSAASVAGTAIGFAVIAGAYVGFGKVKKTIDARNAKKNQDN